VPRASRPTSRWHSLLEVTPIIDDIVIVYAEHKLMPPIILLMLPSALASYYGVDYLLTWNCLHLAKRSQAGTYRKINERLRLRTPTLTTPENLFASRRGVTQWKLTTRSSRKSARSERGIQEQCGNDISPNDPVLHGRTEKVRRPSGPLGTPRRNPDSRLPKSPSHERVFWKRSIHARRPRHPTHPRARRRL